MMRIELKQNNQPTREEIIELARGQESVTIAGEEPLERKGITEIIKELSNPEIWVETRGDTLSFMAEKLKKAGVTGVKLLINTFRYTSYKKQTGKDNLETVIQGINAVIDQKMKMRFLVKIEKGFNDSELMDLLQFTLQHNYEIVFTKPTGMTTDEIKAKMPALRPTTVQEPDVEFFKYPGAVGKIGFLRVL